MDQQCINLSQSVGEDINRVTICIRSIKKQTRSSGILNMFNTEYTSHCIIPNGQLLSRSTDPDSPMKSHY